MLVHGSFESLFVVLFIYSGQAVMSDRHRDAGRSRRRPEPMPAAGIGGDLAFRSELAFWILSPPDGMNSTRAVGFEFSERAFAAAFLPRRGAPAMRRFVRCCHSFCLFAAIVTTTYHRCRRDISGWMGCWGVRRRLYSHQRVRSSKSERRFF